MQAYFEEEYNSLDFYINRWYTIIDWPLHLHSHIELIYVRRGSIEVTVDAQTRVLHKGDFAVAFPNVIHEYRRAAGVADGDVVFFIAMPSMTGDFADQICNGYPQKPFVTRQDFPEDASVALEMLKHQQGEYNRQLVKGYLQVVLSCLWPQLQVVPIEHHHKELPYRAVQYISEHFTEPLTLERVAKALGVTKNHLSRVFSGKLQTSFLGYLHFLRIDRAKDMLCHTRLPVLQVALECGYDTPRTFNRVFMEQCGMSPREYRQRTTGTAVKPGEGRIVK